MKIVFLCSLLLLNTIASLAQCEDFEMNISITHPSCHGFSDGSITISLEGGDAPYTLEITNEAGDLFFTMGGTINLLSADCYMIDVVDASGCELMDSVKLIDPGLLDVDLVIIEPETGESCDGMIVCDTVYNYQGDYELVSYFWSPLGEGGIGMDTVTDVCSEFYTLTINDEYGCSRVFDFDVNAVSGISTEEKVEIELFVNIQNQELMIKSSGAEKRRIKLFSLGGQVVFEHDILEGEQWLKPVLNPGVYLFQIENEKGILKGGKLKF